jgi:parallel beta-helix repeat protein
MSTGLKKIPSGRITWLIGLFVLLLVIPAAVSAGDTYFYVDDNPSGGWTTTVINSPGTWILMNDVTGYGGAGPAILIASNNVVLDGNGHTLEGAYTSPYCIPACCQVNRDYPTSNGVVVAFGAQNVHVKDLTVKEFIHGIWFVAVNGGKIENVNVIENERGIELLGSNNIDITDVNADSNFIVDIFSQYGNTNTIHDCNVTDDEDSKEYPALNPTYGILVWGEIGDSVVDNRIEDTTPNTYTYNPGLGCSCPQLDRRVQRFGIYFRGLNGIIENNDVSNCQNNIFIDRTSGTAIEENIIHDNTDTLVAPCRPQTLYDDISLWGSPSTPFWPGNVIKDNEIAGNVPGEDGILLNRIIPMSMSSHDNLIDNNTISSTNRGIALFGCGPTLASGDNTIINNTLTQGGYGIILAPAGTANSNYNTIRNNIVEDNQFDGITLQGVSSPNPITGNVIADNEVNRNDQGIYLIQALLNTVDGNQILGNTQGTHLWLARQITVVNNTIIDNAGSGLHLEQSQLNTIYNNCFNNTYNAAFDPAVPGPNNWNTLVAPGPNIVGGKYFGGNYWAKPDGTGHSQIVPNNSDEFTNEYYTVDGPNNIDYFPLWNPLSANFTYTPASGSVPLTVDFTDTSYGNPTCWYWDFDDGDTSTEQNPSHTYTAEGVYDVSLTVSRCDVEGCANSSTYVDPIVVGPHAFFKAHPLVGPAPLTVAFTDLSIPATVDSWTWFYRLNNTAPWTQFSTDRNPLFEFPTPGKYDIRLDVTGIVSGNTFARYNYIDVRTPFGPVADFTASPQSGDIPLTVLFLDESTYGPTSWSWDFDDGDTSTEQNPTHVFTDAGDYTVNLTVSNTGGSSYKTLVVHAQTPQPIADFIASPRTGYTSLEVFFYDQSASTTASAEYYWEFGDGGTSTEKDPVHTYSAQGSYNVKLTVTNPGPVGFEESDSIQKNDYIVVSDEPIPVASILPHGWWLLSGDMPFTVDFEGVSTYSPTTWLWTFGDGTSANQQDVSHTFTAPGVYHVTLRVFDVEGRGTQDTVVVVVRPVASFTANPQAGDAPLTVHFTDTSSGNPDEFFWNFHGGFWVESTEKDPEYTFLFPGTYYVNHWVRENGVFSLISTESVVIGDTPAIHAWPTQGEVPLEVDFTGIAGGFPVDWLWEFGDGHYLHGQNVTHTYEDTGIYTVKLTAYYSYHDPVSTTKEIRVRPDADFSMLYLAARKAPLTVQFEDMSRGDISSWHWFASDGWTSTEENPSHTFTQSGYYLVRLEVETPEGLTDSEVQFVTVFPDADFTWYPSKGEEPLTVQFVDTSLGGGFMSIWDFGDGTNATFYDSPGRSAPVHVYEELGTYTVSLTRVGYDYLPDTETKMVNLMVQPPVADFTGTPRAGSAPLTVDFTDLSTGASPIEYFWEFGDGSTSTTQNPSHTYNANGDYTVSLSVTNDGGFNIETKVAYIRVSNVPLPVAEFTASPVVGLEDLTVQFKDTSINSPTSWQWDFGDGTSSTLQSPLHTYTTPGHYDVMLTVSNAQGQNTIAKSSYIYVKNTPPTAIFTATPLSGDAALSVKFTDQSTGNGISSWHWDFGDGGTSTIQSPVYVYNNAGTYTVNLTVANDGGSDSEVKTNYITVNAAPPVPPANVIELYPGWNFVSVPKKLGSGDETAIQVFGDVDLGGHALLTYDAAAGMWKQVTAATVLKPLDGYWIYSVTRMDVNLTFDPNPYIQSPKPVYEGYNAIGPTGLTSMSARDTLTLVGGLDGHWDVVLGYHDGMMPDDPIIRDSSDPRFSDNRPMYPTRGYWLLMNTDDSLRGV